MAMNSSYGWNINPNAELLSEEIVARARQLGAAILADAMNGFGVMDYQIKPFSGEQFPLVGTALTLNVSSGNNQALLAKTVAMASRGYVIVIDAKGNTTNAVIGDMMARTAMKAGAAGAVINGVFRDVREIRELGFPVFARGTVPVAVQRMGAGEINFPMACAGAQVAPGDLVVGDEDGVVVVPRDKISLTFECAASRLEMEKKRIDQIQRGILEPEWLVELFNGKA